MLIQITNTCHMGCKHCLNDSTPDPQHMTMETWDKCMIHAKAAGANVLLISGGEPTEHPSWKQIISEACDNFIEVVVPTNGMWINTSKEADMLDLLERYYNCSVQITSVGSYYPLHHQTCTAVRKLKQRLKNHPDRAMRRIEFNQIKPCIDVDIHLVSLGRAANDELCEHIADRDLSTTTSCVDGALVAVQTDYRKALRVLEQRGHFCKPRINYKGEIGWSESALCPNFATVEDSAEEVQRKVSNWRPCGKCKDYQKLLRHPAEQYCYARSLLGIAG